MSDENEEDSIYIEPHFLISDNDFTFEQISKEKCNPIKAIRDREYGFLKTRNNQSSLFTPSNSIWFQRYFFNSLNLIQSFNNSALLEEHSANVQSVDFSFTGDHLCSGGNDLKVAIWDWKEENLSHIYYSGHVLKIRQCKWSIDSQSIVTCSDDNDVRIGNVCSRGVATSKIICTHQGPVNAISFCEANVILSCGEDGSVFQIDLREEWPKELVCLRKKQMPLPLYSIDCNMYLTPHLFATSGQGANVRMYDRRYINNNHNSHCVILKPDHFPRIKHFSVTCIQNCPFSSKLLASYNNSDLYIFDVSKGTVIKKLVGHCCRPILNKCCWFGEQFVFSTSSDGYIYAWDVDNKHPIFCAQADEVGNVNSIAVHRTDPLFATCGSNCDVKVWSQSVKSDTFNYDRIKQRIIENLNERKIYEYYCSYLDENQERELFSSISSLFENRLFRQDLSSTSESSSENEDYDTFEELECIQS